ncbi:MAG: hypothetical protein GEU79_13055 [Acidimicrobiia bacterium]|nr:hypothetical protein [Acidimicrobiia bacterium]
MVILYIDPDSELVERLALLRAGRDDRNRIILQRLEDLGISIEPDELLEKAGKGAVGRPHIAAILMERGHVESIAMAFDMYLARGRPAYVDRPRLPPEDAFRLARDGGGVPVLAHPHTLGLDRATQIADALDWLKSIGLVGIEAHYGGYDGFHRSGMVALAEKFGLVPSGGSDFHGTYKPETLLGTGSRGIAIPDSVLDELDSVRP